jgi:hypothetical protein
VACEEAQAITASDVPHAYCAVARAREDVEVVRVESNAVHIVVVTDVDAQRLDMIRGPEARGAVIGACQEVVSVGSPLDIPDWVIVATIGDKTGIRVQ